MSVENEVIYQSLISVCQNVEVVLRNKFLRAQGSRQGMYQLGEIVNGKQSWKSATDAIWFILGSKDWCIGPLSDIGTDSCGIASFADKDQSLFNVANDDWRYSDDGWKVMNSGDIAINCDTGISF